MPNFRSIRGLVLGPIFFFASVGLLIWNEGNSVKQHKTLKEGLKDVMAVPSANSIDSDNEGKLVHFIGKATTETQVYDNIFGITPYATLKLKRTVEMYQWVEHGESSSNGGSSRSSSSSSTYSHSYTKEWRQNWVNSNAFDNPTGHENPSSMRWTGLVWEPEEMDVGAFILSEAIIQKMDWFDPIATTVTVDTIVDEQIRQEAQVHNNGYYFGADPLMPEVGDTRVSFQVVPEQTISVVAEQVGSSLATYITESGGTVLLVEAGTHDATEIFLHATQDLEAQTWAMRLAGFLFLFVAFRMLTLPLSAVANMIPILGRLIEAGATCFSFLAAAVCAATIIAVSWVLYRPLMSVLLLVGIGAVVYAMDKQQERRRAGTGNDDGIVMASQPPTGGKGKPYSAVSMV